MKFEILPEDFSLERMEFDNAPKDKQITFSSSYYCWNFLTKQIVMEKLEKE